MKKIFVALAVGLGMSAFVALPAFAAGGTCPDGSSYTSSEAECGYNKANGGKDGADLPESVEKLINGAIEVAGLVAVIYMVVCATNMMTSNGDTAKVATARKGMIYAAIGLAVCVLSYIIVNFVLKKII